MLDNEIIGNMINSLPDGMSEKVSKAWDDLCLIVENDNLVANPMDILIPGLPTILRYRGSYLVSPGEEYIDSSQESVVNNTGYYLLIINARQGGGNDECFCSNDDDSHDDFCLFENNQELRQHPSYIEDFYDSYDPTYITFIFENNIDQETINKSHAALKANAEYSYAQETHTMVTNNIVPIWYILDPNKALYNKLTGSINRYNLEKDRIKNIDKDQLFSTQEFIDNLINNDTIDIDFMIPKKYLKGSYFPQSRIKKDMEDYIKAENEMKFLKDCFEEANNLPDGNLKTFLLSSENGSLLRKMEHSQYSFDSCSSILSKTIDRTKKDIKIIADRVKKDTKLINNCEKNREKIESYRKELWEQGYDKKYPMPPQPYDFFAF